MVIEVGVVGFGLAGQAFHAPVIDAVEGMRVAAIVQRHADSARALYPQARIVSSLDELLAIESVRLVVIATPNPSHAPLAKQALLAGRDVVIDKPFATSLAEATELVNLARKTGRLLSVYQNRRWDGDFLTVRQLLSAGKLGRVSLLESHFDRFRPQIRQGTWKERAEAGSGILFDLGPHLIDQALTLFGVPEAVTGDVRKERDGSAIADAFDVVLHYPRARALLRSTMLAAARTPRFVVQGTAGSYVKFGLDPQEEALRRGQRPAGEAWGMEPQEMWGTVTLAGRDGLVSHAIPTLAGNYRKYYENVRDTLLGKAPLAVTAAQALDTMRVIDLALESSQRRCTVAWME